MGYNKPIQRSETGGEWAYESSARTAAVVNVWAVFETAACEKEAVCVGFVAHDGAEETKRHIPHSG